MLTLIEINTKNLTWAKSSWNIIYIAWDVM